MATDWGSSGLAYLTGTADGAPDFSRAGILARAQRVADGIADETGLVIDAATILAGRAGLLGLTRRGRISAGGSTRLMAGQDGWCALTLSRPDDVVAIPALTESEHQATDSWDPWPEIEQWVSERGVDGAVSRARLLGIPAAVLGETSAAAPRVHPAYQTRAPHSMADLLVVDLSSMWAGPLCGQLLRQAGATVIKVESPSRPDGTRGGPAAFFDWMNSGKLSYAADFDADVVQLRTLLAIADVVIEGSRPAALTRRGLGPDDCAARAGRVWLRITGHGTVGEHADRVAFGDDAAVAGGLVGDDATGPVFCGDAVADPLTGLEATRAVLESQRRGGGELIEVSMAEVAATYASLPVLSTRQSLTATPPVPIPPSAAAARLGADNELVCRMIAERPLAAC